MNLRIYRDEYTPSFIEWLCAKFEYNETSKCVELVGLTEMACEIIMSCMMRDEDSLQGERSAIVTAMNGII